MSTESPSIYALIKELYEHCNGFWDSILDQKMLEFARIGCADSKDGLDRFLWYAATFLSNLGNYYVLSLLSKHTLYQTSDQALG